MLMMDDVWIGPGLVCHVPRGGGATSTTAWACGFVKSTIGGGGLAMGFGGQRMLSLPGVLYGDTLKCKLLSCF
jgi:hypothetical protein